MDTPILSDSNLLDLTIRLSIAIVAGGSIGLDRYIHHKAGGLRTHMLVSLGAALFTIVPIALVIGTASQYENRTDIDSLGRIVQGIAAGVGFLGAGEILHTATSAHQDTPIRVTGLTSAASIWVTAAIGVIAGCGLWKLAIVATVMTISILTGLKYLERGNGG
ncbi:MgtC/SapB family protein [Chamaesiphon sp. VAR_48_metabat_135_sub]|uniref:MgtC/SapB family protein n=1 Tax=Chamaesiphon sp. VAR_48_metabat_135_sub TaxID=2964699 RepID=UPI00286CB0DF|nr:MgtC/SapB family protein [Chamaesiphon sp. VAR_48_metabat_135_sub]